MWLEQLALVYNQAMRNSMHLLGQTREGSDRWRKRCEKLFPLLDAEMQEAKGRAGWVNGYAIVYPDARTRADAYLEIMKKLEE